MKRRMLTRSLTFALGTSLFLYADYAFAETVIYDPVNPNSVITPLTGSEEIETATTSNTNISTESTTTSEEERKKEPVEEKSKAKKLSATPHTKQQKPKKRNKNHVLILDEDYLSKPPIVSPIPQTIGGTGGMMEEFSDISQGAYLLAGTVLYGERTK